MGGVGWEGLTTTQGQKLLHLSIVGFINLSFSYYYCCYYFFQLFYFKYWTGLISTYEFCLFLIPLPIPQKQEVGE